MFGMARIARWEGSHFFKVWPFALQVSRQRYPQSPYQPERDRGYCTIVEAWVGGLHLSYIKGEGGRYVNWGWVGWGWR